ncbi:MAG: hypothetical protein K8H84_00170, partial [Sulfuricella denitrificans]|nr:hypothetical protein [Sulfuricella denitrificans]
LVITAGTSVSAIAGALGKETWRYTLESGWIRLGTDHVPWLPSVRAYQKKWDAPWEPLLDQIGQDLESWAGEERKA